MTYIDIEGQVRMPDPHILRRQLIPMPKNADIFDSDDEEFARLQAREKEVLSGWRGLIDSPGTYALQFQKWNGHLVVASRSTEPDRYTWRLSYFDDQGAIMHEEFHPDESRECGRTIQDMLMSMACQVNADGLVEVYSS